MKHEASALLAAAMIAWGARSAVAQQDLLLPLKVTQPNVLFALDLSSGMQRDVAGVYLDPVVFARTGEPYEISLGVTNAIAAGAYRRRYVGLDWLAPGGQPRAQCRRVEVAGDLEPGFDEWDGVTRLGRVRTALGRVLDGNAASVRFGLIASRQASPRLDTVAWPTLTTAVPGLEAPTDGGSAGVWLAGLPVVDGPGSSAPSSSPLVAADQASANTSLRRLLERRPGTTGALLPAGEDRPGATDAPLGLLLDDARSEAARLVAADADCRNTVVVLIAAGADPSSGTHGLGEKAAAFLSVGGRRVRVYVVALAPPAEDVDRLREVATRSGGQYLEVSAAAIDRVPASAPVPEIVAALHEAVQHAFASSADFNAMPSGDQPSGPPSYFPTVGPVVGTVNLENGHDALGILLANTRVVNPLGAVLPQPSNVMVTAGFDLPGFHGRLSAFRVYRPVADAGQVTGYRFSTDGTRIWTAHAPDPEQRNVYTVLPGLGIVPFRSSNATALAPFLGVRDAAALVDAIRALPVGPSLNSTPAVLEPPSDRFTNAAYEAFVEANRRRRGLVFAGADDGMMHAFDARTGVEVWALIPFNLLPKLRRLPEGFPLDAYPYGVEGSPRLADVDVSGRWRTYLVFGEGPGGTFYQALDVTLDGIASSVPPDADSLAALLAWFAVPSRIPFAWSFPRYADFDASTPPFGDLAAGAADIEKSVGETWSTPSVGRAGGPAGVFVAVVGSGRLAHGAEESPSRGGVRAGTRVYVLDMASGAVLDSRDVGTDGVAESQDACPSAGCAALKNAVQADPVARTDEAGAIRAVYAGDLDGRLWRFDLSSEASPGFAGAPQLLFSAGADQPIFGSVARLAGTAGQSYLFFGTGSELVRRAPSAGYRLVGLTESGGGVAGRFERLLRTSDVGGLDEAPAGAPVVGGGVVFFATTAKAWGGCSPPESSLYALTTDGGVAYDENGDARRDEHDIPVVARVAGGRASQPVVADRHLFLAAGSRLQVFGDPDGFAGPPPPAGLRVLSWREIRQP